MGESEVEESDLYKHDKSSVYVIPFEAAAANI